MASIEGRELLAGGAGGLAGTVAVHYLRGLPWSLSAIVGFAMGVLVVYSLRSGRRIRQAWRAESWRRDADDEGDRD